MIKTVYEVNEMTLELAKKYSEALNLPFRAQMDLYHIALSTANGMDYILSWNFKHIANVFIRQRVSEINNSVGLITPTICTPEELIGAKNG
jgi:hypothetical protein